MTTASSTARLGALRVRPVVLAAVGDVTPGEQVGRRSRAGSAYPWATRRRRTADRGHRDREPRGRRLGPRSVPVPDKQYHFRGCRRCSRGAGSARGLDVVTLANNHALDLRHRRDSLDTIRYAHGRRDRRRSGQARRRSRAATRVHHGRRPAVAFLGYSDVNPPASTRPRDAGHRDRRVARSPRTSARRGPGRSRRLLVPLGRRAHRDPTHASGARCRSALRGREGRARRASARARRSRLVRRATRSSPGRSGTSSSRRIHRTPTDRGSSPSRSIAPACAAGASSARRSTGSSRLDANQ